MLAILSAALLVVYIIAMNLLSSRYDRWTQQQGRLTRELELHKARLAKLRASGVARLP